MCLGHRVSVSILCPLGQPKKAIGHESQIESWLPRRIRLAGCVSGIDRVPLALSLLPPSLRTVLAVKDSLRGTYRRPLDGSGPF